MYSESIVLLKIYMVNPVFLTILTILIRIFATYVYLNLDIHLKIRERRSAQNNVTSKEDAETICISAFERSEPYKTCREYVSDLSGASFFNCIKDVIVSVFDFLSFLRR